MKKHFILPLVVLFSCLSFMASYAQDSIKKVKPAAKPYTAPAKTYTAPAKPYTYKSYGADTTKPTDNTLRGQYLYLLTKVYGYQQPLVGAYHKSITDTLNLTRKELKTTQAQLATSTKTIDSLNTTLKANVQTLNESNSKVNAIDLVGASIPKTTYNLIMWGLVIIFAAVAAIVLSRSGIYSREAKYRTQLYNELDEEFKTYKIKANEKEKKLARELQTERNKLDDMLGKE